MKNFLALDEMQMFEMIMALSFAFFSVILLKFPAIKAINLVIKLFSWAKISLVLILRSLK